MLLDRDLTGVDVRALVELLQDSRQLDLRVSLRSMNGVPLVFVFAASILTTE